MNDDKALLEAAARAAGIKLGWDARGAYEIIQGISGNDDVWNPLTDDGDALRLAVSCGLVVDTSRPSAGEPFKLNRCEQADFQDRNAATRRAIVMAAAALGQEAKHG